MPPDLKDLSDEDLAAAIEEASVALEIRNATRKRLKKGTPGRTNLWKSVRRLREQLSPLEEEDRERRVARKREADSPRVEPFLADLKVVYEKYQLVISSCGCCDGVHIYEAEGGETGYKDLIIDGALEHLRDSGIG